MKKLLLLLILLVPCFAAGQYSTVTATITDSDSQTWNNGTYQITFVPPVGASTFTFNGQPWNPPAAINGALSGSGGFSYANLPRNDYILPTGSKWQFSFCPNASFRCSPSSVVINSSSQSITGSLTIVVPRFPAGNQSFGAFGYLDVEITSPVTTQQYWNVTLGCNRVYGASTWACGGGSSSIFTALSGDANSTSTGGATTVVGINNTNIAALGTGLFQVTNGVPSKATSANVQTAIGASVYDASGAAATAQTNAQNFASNASNLASGTVPAAQIGGTLNPNTVSDNTGASIQYAWLSTQGSGQTNGTYQAYDATGGAIVSYVVSGNVVSSVRVIAKGAGYQVPITFPTSAAGGTAGTISTSLSSPFIACAMWGDSLTDGGGGYNNTPIPQLIQTYTGTVCENGGRWGQTASEIAVSTGALTSTMTITGGTVAACASLPCATGTAVTFTINYEPVNSFGPYPGISGTCTNGGTSIRGNVIYSSGPTYTFTPTQIITATTLASCTFQSDIYDYGYIPIIWAGRNDVTNGTSIPNAESAIAAMYTNKPSKISALVLGVITQTTEPTGSTNWNTITAMNATLASTYTNCATPLTANCNFLSPQAILIASANPTNVADWYDANTNKTRPLSYGNPYILGILAAGINNSVTTFTITVQANGTGYAYSGATSGYLVLDTGANQEEVYCTTISGSAPNLTASGCTRNDNGSGAFAHSIGVVSNMVDTLHIGTFGQTIIATQIAQWLAAHLPLIQSTGGQNVILPAPKPIYASIIYGIPPTVGPLYGSTNNTYVGQAPTIQFVQSSVTNAFAVKISEADVNILSVPIFGTAGNGFYWGTCKSYVNGGAVNWCLPIAPTAFGGQSVGTASQPYGEMDVAYNSSTGYRFPNNFGSCCTYSYIKPYITSGAAAAGDVFQTNGSSGYGAVGLPLGNGTAVITGTTNVTAAAVGGHTLLNRVGKIVLTGNVSASTGSIATIAFSVTLATGYPKECVITEVGSTLHSLDTTSLSTTGFTITAGITMASQTVTAYYNCQ